MEQSDAFISYRRKDVDFVKEVEKGRDQSLPFSKNQFFILLALLLLLVPHPFQE